MSLNCINLKKRTKKSKPYLYCSLLEKETTFDECNKCPNKRYKQLIKKVSKKRVFVQSETYSSVFERDKGKCVLCDTQQSLHLHHIIYRSKDKSKINDINNCVILCFTCHELVHSNKKKYKPMLEGYVVSTSK